MKRSLFSSIVVALGIVFSLPGAHGQTAAIELNNNELQTPRHVISLAPSGLPSQIAIKIDEQEKPLAYRDDDLGPAQLRQLGRGNTLKNPIAIQAVIDAKVVEAEIAKAAKPEAKGDSVVCESEMTFGDTSVSLDLTYGADGSIQGSIVYGGGKVDALEMIIPFNTIVDSVVAGQPTADKVQAYPPTAYTVGTRQGLAWGNSEADAQDLGAVAKPGVLTHMYVGNGDQGFTWLCNGADGWTVDPKASTMTVERNENLEPVWHIRLVNHTAELRGRNKIEFALLTHPATAKPASHRRKAWLDWPVQNNEPATAGLSLATWQQAKPQDLVRADAATVLEGITDYALLDGPAGGDALSAEKNHTDTYPIELIRYLAGTHTGNIARLKSNAVDISNPGADPAADRVLLGRALLLDIGLDVGALANLTDGKRVLEALLNFGYFENDEKTEFIPYWRSSQIVRFGQPFSTDDVFETDMKDPLAEVYVSAYVRPTEDGKRKVMIVVVNESNHSVRDSLYILNPSHIFDGVNILTSRSVISKLDFTNINERSDWGKPGATWVQGYCLEDLEDHGRVDLFRYEDGIESYGPNLFIPPHSFRILGGIGGQPENQRLR